MLEIKTEETSVFQNKYLFASTTQDNYEVGTLVIDAILEVGVRGMT